MIGLLCLMLGLAGAADPQTVRLALVAGANDGGVGRMPLRYALSDAESMASVLSDVGGVHESDIVRLDEPDPESMEAALVDLRSRIRELNAGSDRTEVFVYYSGHSDETGLMLGGSRYRFDRLRGHLETLGADVTVAIVDSCSSGALVRTKGGQVVPAFLQDQSTQVQGLAVLTSSSQDEASQESDRLGGSFFTQAMVAALRGAADEDGDQRVTIGEAYRYAYDETLSRTESTTHGAQHPNWDIRLKGTGDLVVSDVSVAESGLVVAAGRVGRLVVRDEAGNLVLELGLMAEATPELALPAGTYTVLLEQERAAWRAGAILVPQETLTLGPESFFESDLESTQARGAELQHVVTGATWLPDLAPDAEGASLRHTLSFGLLGHRAGRLDGLAMVLGYSAFDHGVSGVQLGLFFARSDANTDGVQLSALGAFTRRRLRGVQIGGVATTPELRGFHAGGLTQSGDVQGVQLGLINIGSNVRGAQVGGLNIAGRVTGVQIGAINIATKRSDASIGAVTIARDGMANLELSVDSGLGLNVGAKLGSRWMYTAYALGLGAEQRLRPGVGLGGRASLGAVELDMDAFVAAQLGPGFDETELSVDPGVRLTVGVPVTKWLAPIVGLQGYLAVPVLGDPQAPILLRDGIGAGANAYAGVRF